MGNGLQELDVSEMRTVICNPFNALHLDLFDRLLLMTSCCGASLYRVTLVTFEPSSTWTRVSPIRTRITNQPPKCKARSSCQDSNHPTCAGSVLIPDPRFIEWKAV